MAQERIQRRVQKTIMQLRVSQGAWNIFNKNLLVKGCAPLNIYFANASSRYHRLLFLFWAMTKPTIVA
jgi:hypothetical protein